ncbi:hypothetical protein Rsub_04358 [Raphidocelis subcapitata]|uniref:Uncharacterized protein n=1 Tax=Raphidocelis subcapitata TaxID=307507 RepID=A0A2V0NVE6_9CHLO|nr:hypothetical protein Rsub_04358 [Raphidocelis subcapitata]|eukprot:GBF91618.1 hypothetical protein Rsub_04358 [Raphidocelis subcapitata]
MQAALSSLPVWAVHDRERALAPWFEEAAPGLLTNKAIRRFLEGYSPSLWPEVLKLALLHGLIAIQAQHPGQTLSPAQLRALVERGAVAAVVERKLPALQREMLDLQARLDAVYDEVSGAGRGAAAAAALDQLPQQQLLAQKQRPQLAYAPAKAGAGAAAAPPPDTRPRDQRAAGALPGSRTANLLGMAQAARGAAEALRPPPRRAARAAATVVAPKPSAAWREGEPTGYPPSRPQRRPLSPLRRSVDNQAATNPIYPEWWGDPVPKPAPPPAAPPPPRPQPRLAYSAPQQENRPQICRDDLVTAEYLAVPSSGYGRPAAAAPAPAAAAAAAGAEAAAAALAAAARDAAEQAAEAEECLVAGMNAAIKAHGGEGAGPGNGVGGSAASAAPRAPHSGRARWVVPPAPGSLSAAAAAAAAPRAAAGVRFAEPPASAQDLRRRVAGAASKIKAEVDASRRAQALRQRGGAPAAPPATAGPCAPRAAAGDAEGPAGIVDGFLSNPWASWFLPGHGGAGDGGEAAQWAPPDDVFDGYGGDEGEEEEEEEVEEAAEGFSDAGSDAGHEAGPAAAAAPAAAAPWQRHAAPAPPPAEPAAALLEPWACDYGHLEHVQAPEPKPRRARRAAAAQTHRPEAWAGKWVGEFGHLQGARFSASSAFAHHAPEGAAGAAEQAGGLGGLFMSADELRAFVGSPARGAEGRRGASGHGGDDSGDDGGDGAASDRPATTEELLEGIAEAEQRLAAATAAAARPRGPTAAPAAEHSLSGASAGAAGSGATSTDLGGSSVDDLISSLLARIELQQQRALAAAGLGRGTSGGEESSSAESAADAAGAPAAAAGAATHGAEGGAAASGRLGATFSAMRGALNAALNRAAGPAAGAAGAGLSVDGGSGSDSGSSSSELSAAASDGEGTSSTLTLSEGSTAAAGR